MEQKDLRVRRTKKLVMTAFVELLDEVGLDKINVNSLTQRAEINRVTFYLHYKDMDDFIERFIDELFTDLRAILQENYSQPFSRDVESRVIEQLLHYIAAKRKIFRSLLVSKSVPYFTQLFMELIRNMIEQRNRDQLIPNTYFTDIEVEHDIASWYTSSALIGTISMWLDSDLKYSPRYLTQQILKLSPIRQIVDDSSIIE